MVTGEIPRVRLGLRPLLAIAACLLGLLALWLWTGWGGTNTTTAATDVASLLSALAACVACGFAAARVGGERRPWVVLAAACGMWAIGEAIWGYFEVIADVDVPFPSVADVAYLGAVPIAAVGLLAFARRGGGTRALRTLIDGSLIAASLLCLTWATVLGPVWNSRQGSWLEQLVNLAYPVTDVALGAVALVVVGWCGARRRPLLLLAGSLLVMGFTDSAFTWLTNQGTYSSTDVVSVGWVAAYFGIAIAAITAVRDREHRVSEEADEVESVLSAALPYLALFVGALVLVLELVAGKGLDEFLIVDACVLAVMVLARQALTLVENRRLASRLHDSLERLQAREAELAHLALHDPLTGLANRSHLSAELDARPRRHDWLLYLDLDGFKAVNDHFGHGTGDVVLVEAATRLRACCPPSAFVARLGGDEFVALIDGHIEDAERVATSVIDACSLPIAADGEVVKLGASIGIAALASDDGDDPLRRADAAMYVAKRNGRGQAVHYPDHAVTRARD